MFHQATTPVAGSLPLSFLVAALPNATVLILLGVMRRPAWQSSLGGLLVPLAFPPIFNTAPVAFGALGTPVTVLGQVTGLSPIVLGALIGRQLPFIALLLPFYVMALYGGMRSVRALWPMLLVAGGSFAIAQFITSNYIDYALTDVFSSM